MDCPKCGKNDGLTYYADMISNELFEWDVEDGCAHYIEQRDNLEECNTREWHCDACNHDWEEDTGTVAISRDHYNALRAACQAVASMNRNPLDWNDLAHAIRLCEDALK